MKGSSGSTILKKLQLLGVQHSGKMSAYLKIQFTHCLLAGYPAHGFSHQKHSYTPVTAFYIAEINKYEYTFILKIEMEN